MTEIDRTHYIQDLFGEWYGYEEYIHKFGEWILFKKRLEL
jgi:hypothetical protein